MKTESLARLARVLKWLFVTVTILSYALTQLQLHGHVELRWIAELPNRLMFLPTVLLCLWRIAVRRAAKARWWGIDVLLGLMIVLCGLCANLTILEPTDVQLPAWVLGPCFMAAMAGDLLLAVLPWPLGLTLLLAGAAAYGYRRYQDATAQ